MADSTGTTLRGSRYCPEYSKKNPTSRLDPGHSIVGRTQRETGQVRPRWFGQDLSEVPDSGIGHTQDNRMDQDNEVLCEPDTYQPTRSQPIRRKRQPGDRLETRSYVDRGVRREGTRWGTPRKRALFGPDGPDSMSSGSDVAEYQAVAQSGRPYEDEYLEEAWSPRVELVNVVARLQKELAEFRTEFGYGSARGPASSSQTTRGSGFTSTSVPRYSGKSSWDQYRQVFEAIVCSNGWDGVTAALQRVSHLEGDTLNVALLVPESQRVLTGVLVGALSEHYGSPGRLAECKRQFERASRRPGDDPSVFAIELETLARRAFVDVNASVQLQLVCDRLVAGQVECTLRRNLDSMGPDTPMRDIVDSCRVWESHAEDIWGSGQDPEYPRAIYQVVEDTQPPVALKESEVLDQIRRHLLPMPAVLPPKATPIPSDRDLLIQRLLGAVHPVQPVVQEHSRLTDIEILLQSMLPV